MKYLCLVYVEETVLNAMAKPERQSLSDESMAFCDELQKKRPAYRRIAAPSH